MNEISRCCRVLGVKHGASFEDVKKAYRDLVQVWHPDRFSDSERLQVKAQEQLREIIQAYDHLVAGAFQDGILVEPADESAAEPDQTDGEPIPSAEEACEPSMDPTEPAVAAAAGAAGRKFIWVAACVLAILAGWGGVVLYMRMSGRVAGASGEAADGGSRAVETLTNALSAKERKEGWKLLFNGTNASGWHNFKKKGVRSGWVVQDGALVCVDPPNAGDIVTDDKFDWFELELDYNISEAGNSGIMFHVTTKGNAVWNSGPEFQLEDNVKGEDKIRTGWLYALYQPPDDPKTGQPLDATKPAGEWNHVRLVVSPAKCEHYINGVKYFEYVLHSEDFNTRVARTKFSRMKNFAKDDLGFIALQGDHGAVSFRNIKIHPLKAD